MEKFNYLVVQQKKRHNQNTIVTDNRTPEHKNNQSPEHQNTLKLPEH